MSILSGLLLCFALFVLTKGKDVIELFLVVFAVAFIAALLTRDAMFSILAVYSAMRAFSVMAKKCC